MSQNKKLADYQFRIQSSIDLSDDAWIKLLNRTFSFDTPLDLLNFLKSICVLRAFSDEDVDLDLALSAKPKGVGFNWRTACILFPTTFESNHGKGVMIHYIRCGEMLNFPDFDSVLKPFLATAKRLTQVYFKDAEYYEENSGEKEALEADAEFYASLLLSC